jgi:UDP-N-acetylglucosamine 2-epimerase (non-hydrolysing)
MSKTILVVAGARPNFMKIAPLMREARKNWPLLKLKLIHTGQHYDHDMSDVFFEELSIPKPDYHLNVGAGTQTEQMARIMIEFEKVCLTEKPDAVVVVGDVTSTIAAALVARRLNIRVAHVEAGLRSGDMAMPEEVNRILTDAISDDLFVTEPSGLDNLKQEGKAASSVHYVGHVMVDTLLFQRDKLDAADKSQWLSPPLKAELKRYAVVTLHRPATVDNPEMFGEVIRALNKIAESIPIIFPVHPRTAGNIKSFGLTLSPAIHLTKPLPYMDFLWLWKDAAFVLTDSGGLQEETTALGVPCLTARPSTERPITISEGTNTIVGTSYVDIVAAATQTIADGGKRGRCPQLWDGKAAERILKLLAA